MHTLTMLIRQATSAAVFELLLLLAPTALGQDAITVRVNATQSLGPFPPISAFFGYDEANYTYTNFGRKLIGELAGLFRTPVYIRTHFLLNTGNGVPGLKWGSTNAYAEDASGRPVYDWGIIDRIFETYLQAGAKPFVEIGFMPKALSRRPEPYQPVWIPGARNEQYSIGWSYPPADYSKWGELIYQWVRHEVAKYGEAEVGTWYWEVWNEPDISYWHGTAEEYNRLYDTSAAAVKRALPAAKVGGPATTGPSSARAAEYLRQFLEHCDENNVPLDFITYHAKGQPAVVDGHVRMGMAKHIGDVEAGYRIVASFPKFRNLPIILSESDPEGCAACSARVYPQNTYRNGPLYPAYTAAMMKNILDAGARHRVNLAGMLTWAFEFEDQPYFDGFRTLATNGIDKPALNVFRMAGMMQGDRLAVESSAGASFETILKNGVRQNPWIDGLSARTESSITVLLWNYHDDDVPTPDSTVRLVIAGLPATAKRVLTRHYRIDHSHSNAYTEWRRIGSPQQPTTAQQAGLESAGQLQMLDSPQWISTPNSEMRLQFALPRHAVSLVEISW